MNRPENSVKVLTKNVQSKFAYYYGKLSDHLTKPQSRCVQEMVLGLLKSQSIFINQVAIHIGDAVDLNQTTKRLRNHYNKEGFRKTLIGGHLNSVYSKVSHGDFMILDLSDIQKKYAVDMEGLDYVKDGDSDKIGLGYWLMNIIAIGSSGLITPLYNKLYSFSAETLSENKEILSGIEIVRGAVNKTVTWVIDRGADRPIIFDYFFKNGLLFIIRLTKKRKLWFKDEELAVPQISKKVKLKYELIAEKVKKNKVKKECFIAGAVQVGYKYKGIFMKTLWMVVTKREKGGYSWYLVQSDKKTEQEVVEHCFKGYGYRWKIEQYHRHIKQQYHLEDIQIKTFAGLQTMLSVLTVAMYLIYSEISSMHDKLLLESGIKTLAKKTVRELRKYIYYKIGCIIKILMARVTCRSFLPDIQISPQINGQLALQLIRG